MAPGERMSLCIRAQRLHYGCQAPEGMQSLKATLTMSRYAGGERTAHFLLPTGQTLFSRRTTEGEERFTEGQELSVWWNPATVALVPDEREVQP